MSVVNSDLKAPFLALSANWTKLQCVWCRKQLQKPWSVFLLGCNLSQKRPEKQGTGDELYETQFCHHHEHHHHHHHHCFCCSPTNLPPYPFLLCALSFNCFLQIHFKVILVILVCSNILASHNVQLPLFSFLFFWHLLCFHSAPFSHHPSIHPFSYSQTFSCPSSQSLIFLLQCTLHFLLIPYPVLLTLYSCMPLIHALPASCTNLSFFQYSL